MASRYRAASFLSTLKKQNKKSRGTRVRIHAINLESVQVMNTFPVKLFKPCLGSNSLAPKKGRYISVPLSSAKRYPDISLNKPNTFVSDRLYR